MVVAKCFILCSMNKSAGSNAAPPASKAQLRDTQEAFDSVAADYDGPRGNNDLIQDMRDEMWRWLIRTFAPGERLIDLGCGTGLDAVHLAEMGYEVTATDWSPQMVQRTVDRAAAMHLTGRVRTLNIGAQELERLDEAGSFDGAYSNLGPLNCVPDLRTVSRETARLLKPGGRLVFTVIGRYCPWEIAHYLRRGRWARAKVRFAREQVPVGMNDRTIWTRYYSPREFYRDFRPQFELEHYRGLCVFAPPPYLTWLRDKYPGLHERLWRIDRRVSDWPLIRAMGDHFLIVMKKR
jgi:ubiquinone/menaquinone biosynthesis C-methylase UbiE